nr:putative reverse transcriptase domain-containing protein [Tanacetum cinerariifolium]
IVIENHNHLNDPNIPEGDQAPAAPDGFAPQWISEHYPNNNNGWIEWDMEVPGQDEIVGLSPHVQTLQTALHGTELQNQQLRTRVAEMESHARKYIENACKIFLAQVTKQGSKEKRLEDVPVIRDFPEVFPDKLPGLPPPRQVEFCIDLIPGATLVARVPYRLAPSEMKEFFEQLRELSEKGFIRPSSSPFRAPILFVKKKDGSFRM